MQANRFRMGQVLALLRGESAKRAASVGGHYGRGPQTLTWRGDDDGALSGAEASHLRELELENRELKTLMGRVMLENVVLRHHLARRRRAPC